jgi:hypothetical protein
MAGMRESELGEVDLGEEVDPGVFAHLLAFLYTDSLAGVDANTAIDLIAIADHFMLPRMKNICEIRIQKDVEVENVAYVFHGADMYQARMQHTHSHAAWLHVSNTDTINACRLHG